MIRHMFDDVVANYEVEKTGRKLLLSFIKSGPQNAIKTGFRQLRCRRGLDAPPFRDPGERGAEAAFAAPDLQHALSAQWHEGQHLASFETKIVSRLQCFVA